MIKFIFKVILIVFIMSGLGAYANYLITGNTPNSVANKQIIPDLKLSDVKETISNKFNSIKNDASDKESYLYKWRDSKGIIHYTSEKPLDVANYESIRLSNETNVVPAVPTSELTNKKNIQQSPSTNVPANVYSPEGIEDLLHQAKDIQNLVNEQFSLQEQLSNQE